MVAKIFVVVAALALGTIAAPVADSKPFKIGVTFKEDGKTYYLTTKDAASEKKEDGITCTIKDTASVKGALSCDGDLAYYYNDRHPLEGVAKPITVAAAEKIEKDAAGKMMGLMKTDFVKSNSGWSIGAGDVLSWAAQTPSKTAEPNVVHFSRTKGAAKDAIYAEICSTYGHPDGKTFEPGTVKAYYV